MDTTTLIFSIIVLIFSVIIHEIAHGYVAEWQGDPTPRAQKRLTLNPIPHLDLMGSIIIPLLLVVSGAGFIIGWAKPVQFNPSYFRNKKWGPVLVALAGPLANIVVAILVSLVIRFVPLPIPVVTMLGTVVYINLLLSIFNLIPIPPLDGHHVLFAVLPRSADRIKFFMTRYSLVLFLIVVVFLWKYIQPIVNFLYTILVP
jgi:Zn-dependent protease